jgi:hypothetical protein
MNTKRMLTAVLTLMIGILFMGAVTPAQATHIVTFAGAADCEGWTVDYQVQWRNSPMPILAGLVDYSVVLSQNGLPVETQSGQIEITRVAEENFINYQISGTWPGDLCGDFTVTGEIVLTTPSYPADNADPANQQTFTAAFTCDCPEEDACHYTPGYWKNHASMWPVTSLTLGGVTFDQAQLLVFLNLPVRGDATVILAHHLIAAKLNVANGASSSIQDAIDSADAFLASHPIGSNPRNPAKQDCLAIKDLLCAYNEMGCPGDDGLKSFGSETEEEPASWGSVKTMFR